MYGTADERRTQRLAAIDEPLGMVGSGFPRLRIATQRILVERRHDGDDGALEADVVERLAKPGIVIGSTLEDRDFDAVIAGPLDVSQQWQMSFGDMAGPQEQIETDFHFRSLPPLGISLSLGGLAFDQARHHIGHDAGLGIGESKTQILFLAGAEHAAR